MRQLFLVYNFLNKKEKNFLFILFFLTLISTFLEVLSIGSIIPFFSVMLSGNLSYFYEIFNLTNFNIQSENLILFSLLVLGIIFFLKNIFLIIFTWLDTMFYNKSGKRIADDIFQNYLNSKYIYLLNKKNSKLVYNTTGAINIFRHALMNLVILINELVVFIGLSVFLMILDFKIFSLIVILMLLMMSIIFYSVRNLNYRFGTEVNTHENNFLNVIIQSFEAIKDIKIKKKENFFYSSFEKNNFLRAKYAHLNEFFINVPRFVIELVAISIVLVVVYFFTKDFKDYDILIIKLGVLSASAFRLLPSIFRLAKSYQKLNFCNPILKNLKKEIRESKPFLLKKPSEEMKQNDIMFSDFSAHKINFKYPGSKIKILNNLNVKFKKNTLSLITGKTGSGKTTLLDIITGLIEPNGGFFLINKKKYYKIPNFWINNIAYVAQNIALINDTIQNNITFGEEKQKTDYKKLNQSIKNSQLSKFVLSKKRGLKTLIGEKAVKISGGERQRIALARAFYSNKKIIILDEATNALDKKIENKIFNYLKKEKDKIIIVISHDLSLQKHCNQVIKIRRKENNVK